MSKVIKQAWESCFGLLDAKVCAILSGETQIRI